MVGCGSHRSHGSHGNFCWWEISQNYVGRSHTDSTDSTKIIIREIRGIRVFFLVCHKLSQISTNSKFPRWICGNLDNRSTQRLRVFRALGHSNNHQPLWDLTPSKAKPVGSVRSVWALKHSRSEKNRLLIARINSLCGYSERDLNPHSLKAKGF